MRSATSRPSSGLRLALLLAPSLAAGTQLRAPAIVRTDNSEERELVRGPFADLRSARRRGERQSHGPLQLAERVLEASRPKRLWRECGLGVTVAEDQDAAQELVEPEATSAEPAEPAEPAGSADRARLRRRFRRRRNRKLQRLEASMEEMLPPEIGVEERKKRVLMLISDTGGGHRASAQAMESMLEQVAPGATDVRIVDVWTQYCPFPFNNFVKSYQYMAKHPWMWGVSWYATAVQPSMFLLDTFSRVRCSRGFQRCLDEHDPDLVVSVHPLTQSLPLHLLEKKGGGTRKVPFATVVTDLGGAHPWWFHPKVDACFVPSDAVRRLAERRGLKGEQIRQYGLPVRPSFWQVPRSRDQLYRELNLASDRKTVLVVGGGDGVGSLGKIVEATAGELSRSCPDGAQVVAVCGKNKQLRARLEAMDFGDVNVQVCGFVKQMSDYMEIADVLITKAGPGTIAEATIRGLPTMLSSYLPGQEVPFVIQSGFGEYSKSPATIARTVTGWVQDPERLAAMQGAARAAASPFATQEIASDLLALMEEPDEPRTK